MIIVILTLNTVHRNISVAMHLNYWRGYSTKTYFVNYHFNRFIPSVTYIGDPSGRNPLDHSRVFLILRKKEDISYF